MRYINETFCFAHSVVEKTLKHFSFHIKNRCPWIQFLLRLIWAGAENIFWIKREREREMGLQANIFFIFTAYSWTKSFILFRILIEWLRKPRVKDWNNAFLEKQRWMTIWQESKKDNSSIGETKNRLENLKQNYVAF